LDWGLVILAMELVSSLISFIVGYYALKGYRATGSRGLFMLYMGFMILGIGIFLRLIALAYFAIILEVHEASRAQLLGLVNLTVWIYSVTQILAYSLFAATYIWQSRNIGRQNAAEVASIAVAVTIPFSARLFFIPSLELISIALLGFVSVYAFMNWLLKRDGDAALVFLGFGLMTLSHVFFLLEVFKEYSVSFLLLGQLTQLIGFICLLIMLVKVSKTNVPRA
jgi:hypothetical protein